MRISKKRILLVLAALIVIVALLVEAFNSLASRNRDQVQQELQKVLGKDVTFDRLRVSLFGGFGFSAKGLRVSDDPRFAATPLLQANELILGVSFWNLFLGRLVIASMTLKEPEFQIITNEAGLVNLSALATRQKDQGALPRLSPPTAERRRTAVNFRVSRVRVENGRIAYVDRSITEPAEVQIRNIDMDVKGLDPSARSELKLTAALTEGLARDVQVEGFIGPMIADRRWSQQPIDLQIKFDSLYLPMLARAVAFLRDKIPRELDVTGPMALQMKMTGPVENPRITDFTLNVPLFGSTDYNAMVNGSIDLTTSHSWPEAQLKGKLTLDRIDLKQLRHLSIFEQYLPASFAADGTINVYSRFEGSWDELRVGALIRADRAAFSYRDWLRKPAGTTSRMQLRIARQKHRLVLYPAVLRIGASQLTYSGSIEDLGAPQLRLRLFSPRSRVAAWSHLFPDLSIYPSSGEMAWDIVLSKNLTLPGQSWDARGNIKLMSMQLRQKDSNRRIDNLNAEIFFLGRQARLERASFRLGSSQIAVAMTAAAMQPLNASYEIRSPDLDLADLTPDAVFAPARLRNVAASGVIEEENGLPLLKGIVSSPEGSLKQTSYRNLRAEVHWSPTAMGFKNLSLQVFSGTFRSDAFWALDPEQNHAFEISSEIQAMDAQSVLAELFPKLKNRLQGQLEFHGKLGTVKKEDAHSEGSIEGSGEALIHNGSINDFNLFTQLLTRGSGRSAALRLAASLPEIVSAAVQRRDTPFEILKAHFVVAEGRIRADNLILSTPDYTVTGAGWMGFDRTLKWDGLLVLSPDLTQALQREYKTLRYLLDRRGRLAISFRLEGTLPNVAIKPETRSMARLLPLISPERPTQSPSGGEKRSADKERKQWLPESLDRLLRR